MIGCETFILGHPQIFLRENSDQVEHEIYKSQNSLVHAQIITKLRPVVGRKVLSYAPHVSSLTWPDLYFVFWLGLGPKRTWLNSNIRSNERTFECSLNNSNFAINSMQKCTLIS